VKGKVISATEFKSKCMACLSEIDPTGEPITITKRRRPVAVLRPVKRKPIKSPAGSWARKGRILGDIVNTDFYWECAQESRSRPPWCPSSSNLALLKRVCDIKLEPIDCRTLWIHRR